jgi:hypothetical protein
MRQLLKAIDTGELIGLRDRDRLVVMGYTFACVSAVVTLRVEDYFQQGPGPRPIFTQFVAVPGY